MPRNVYFSQAVRSEQNLYEDLIIESLKIFGQDIYYLPRDLVRKDPILGEDSSSKFDDAYMIEAYIEGTDGFEGQGDLYSKFGLEIRDEVNFVISRKIWDRYVGLQDEVNEDPRPREGDLIFLPLSNKFFEVMFVEHEQPFYQQSNLPTYKLSCTRFEYSSERIDTGISSIDSIEDSLSTDTMNFQFSLENETGSIVLESSIGAIDYMINESFTMADQATNDQGQIFETEAGTNTAATTDDILDFSERNPFGEVDEY